VSRYAALAVALVAAVALPGCYDQLDSRTGKLTLQRAMSRAFKRNYAASYRMVTGRADSLIVRHADARCRPRAAEPTEEGRDWPWFCRIRYYRRNRAYAELVTYGVQVGAKSCFEARSGNFPDRVHEAVLDRTASNPLVYIRSCP
jgi:hypothetical protein